jgi:hypothetical protein
VAQRDARPDSELLSIRRCEALQHPGAYWARRVVTNGGFQVCYWCSTCGRAVTADVYGTAGQVVSVEWLRSTLGIDAQDLPEVRRDLYYKLCSRCRLTRMCEMHHTAMQAAFPDADEWPVIPLCDECHGRWTKGYESYVQRRIQEAIGRKPPQQAA